MERKYSFENYIFKDIAVNSKSNGNIIQKYKETYHILN